MAAAQGFSETYNYSFLSEEAAGRFGFRSARSRPRRESDRLRPDPHAHLAAAWHLAQHFRERQASPRRSGFLKSAARFTRKPEGLPDEILHLMAVSYAREGDGIPGLFDVKRLAECLAAEVEVSPIAARPFEHPERSGQLSLRGKAIGRVFELHPRLGIEGRAAVLDLDLQELEALQPAQPRYRPLRRFPTSAFDLSVFAPLREAVGIIHKRLAEAAGPELVAIEYVRQYTGAPVPDGQKSVSYRLMIGAPDRTMSSDEVGAVRLRIIEAMRAFGYDLRV